MLLQKLEKSREDAVLGNYKDADTVIVIAKMKCGKSPRKKELAFAVRHHKCAAFAAFYKIRSAHFPVCSSLVASCFGSFILWTN